MNGLLSAIKAFVLKSRPAYKDYLGNGKYDIKKLPEECVPDSVCVNIRTAQSTADAAQSTANKALGAVENTLPGKTWTQSDITSGSFFAIYYADGIWVAGSDINGLYYSTNGKTWTQSDITSGSFSALYYADGIWVAGSDINGLYYSQSKFAFAKTVDIQIAEINQSMNQFQRVEGDVIIHSSTQDSTKKFKITVDDTGTISAMEVT